MRENPYSVSDARVKKRVRMVAVTANPLDVVNTVTGEVQRAMPYVGKRAYRDVSDFVKVFDWREIMKMQSYEMKVFGYACEMLEFDGSFRVDYEECMRMTGLSKSGVSKGLRGLVDKDAIRREGNGYYWINPNIAYRGNRDELIDISSIRRLDSIR